MSSRLIRYWNTHPTAGDHLITGDGLVFSDGTPATQHEFMKGHYEALAPDAVIEHYRNDVVCAYNHDIARVLGRQSNGTLTLTRTASGIAYAVQLNPADADHQSILAKVRRGDIAGSSAAFKPLEWSIDAARKLLLFTRILLFEIGPVAIPAMAGTIRNSGERADALSQRLYETQFRLSQLNEIDSSAAE